MNRIISLVLLLTFFVSSTTSVVAQPEYHSRINPEGATKLTRSQFATIEASTDGSGVVIRWVMEVERKNLGFNVYRAGQPDLTVNKRLILGAAAWSKDDLVRGETYQAFDPDGVAGSEYVIESVDLHGGKSFSAQVEAAMTTDFDESVAMSRESLASAATGDQGQIDDLRPTVTKKPTDRRLQPQADLGTHRWVVSQHGVKISVRKDGFYKVACGQLEDAGFGTRGRTTNWRLFMEGVEQAITTGTGDRCIQFYGKGRDEPESDTRIYYLIADKSPGKRIASRSLTSTPTKIFASNYLATAVKKDRMTYVNRVINGDAENYWGSIVQTQPVDIPFNLTGIDFSSPTTQITVNMHGFPNASEPFFGHLVRIRLNGQTLGNISGLGATPFSGAYEVPTSQLLEGANKIEVTSMNIGITMFDSIIVNYGRRFQAVDNRINFTTPTGKRVDVGGFSGTDIRILDLPASGDPIFVTNLPIVGSGGTYTIRLRGSNAFTGYAFEDSTVAFPDSVTENKPSTLAKVANDGELVIISYSHPDFMAASETWANYRRSQGFAVKVVDIADVFDEFSYGSNSSQAINGFLSYASTNWRTKPKYVLLMGDGTIDPRNYQGFGNFNYIPTRVVPLVYSESGSDEALADFNNDGLAELAIGRIPVRTASGIITALNKTMLFETPANQSLDRGGLFAYDIPDGWNFQLTSERIRGELPAGMPISFVGRGMQPPADPFAIDQNAQSNLIAAINSGKHFVNYAGHGSSGLWATAGFFGNTNAVALTNAQRPSVFTMLTCLNGYFLRADPVDSISELLLKNSGGGAVAAWASTAETTPDIQTDMGVRFYEQLSLGQITRLGDLIRDAKTVIPAGPDVRLSWALLGDPMLKVR
ncbi:MAG: C25 family cysteine peptidase [Pyrinomonadaceae bacterium]